MTFHTVVGGGHGHGGAFGTPELSERVLRFLDRHLSGQEYVTLRLPIGGLRVILSRQYFSDLHLNAAVETTLLLARESSEQRSRAFALSAIFLSVAFLEAKINELLEDVVDSRESSHGRMPPHERPLHEVGRLLAEAEIAGERDPTLCKYQKTVEGCKRGKFDKGADPYQSAHLAIDVRNALIHYRPTWVSSNQHGELDTPLKAKLGDRFFLNVTPKNVWSNYIGGFPHECLTHDYALWTIKACASFVDRFFARMTPLLDTWHCADRDRLASEIGRLDVARTTETTGQTQAAWKEKNEPRDCLVGK